MQSRKIEHLKNLRQRLMDMIFRISELNQTFKSLYVDNTCATPPYQHPIVKKQQELMIASLDGFVKAGAEIQYFDQEKFPEFKNL